MWAVMFGHVSNVMMAVNSSVNCIIYGLISPQFRKSMSKKAIAWGLHKESSTERNIRRPSMWNKQPDLKGNNPLENIKPGGPTITSNGTQITSVTSEQRQSLIIDSESDKKSTAATVVVLDQSIVLEDCQTETILGCQRVTQV